jgi:hypothetical protein
VRILESISKSHAPRAPSPAKAARKLSTQKASFPVNSRILETCRAVSTGFLPKAEIQQATPKPDIHIASTYRLLRPYADGSDPGLVEVIEFLLAEND